MNPAGLGAMNLTAAWAALFAEALVRAGVKNAVLSPGSRSTPLAWALARAEGIQVDVVIDERAAGFFALGQAKFTGEPVALVCTSGSALAHYGPAVLEASESEVPLIVVSADRPLSLHGVGANQTLDQTRFFGDHTRGFFELGEPSAALDALRMVKRVAREAVALSLSPQRGPVHINARFRKPLEPSETRDTGETPELARHLAQVQSEPVAAVFTPRAVVAAEGVHAACEVINAARRGVITVGAVDSTEDVASAVVAFAERTGFAVFAEAASQVRFLPLRSPAVRVVDAFDALFAAAPGAFAPDVVVHVGRALSSPSWERFLASKPELPRIVLAEHTAADPEQTASVILRGHVPSSLAALTAGAKPTTDDAFASALAQADETAWASLDAVRDSVPLSEARVAHELVHALPAGSTLVAGNSLPIRMLDRWVRRREGDLRVVSQRGTSGIDGLVALASGVRRASVDPVALLLGDVSLLHDLGSLHLASHGAVPFLIVVVNNDGGRIFEQLPVAEAEATKPLMDLWTTPHGLRFEHGARMFGLDYVRALDGSAFARACVDALEGGRPCVIEAVVDPHDARDRAKELRERLRATLP
jgi:2-succinyl-5-enolpyruvyl-6-hydroxy-3-cyclohexene-1-carboxylate synthase